MKLLHISDTHNLHNQLMNLPEADIIVHTGDFADGGTEPEVLDFLNWFIALPYKYKIFVTGNHDLYLRNAKNIKNLPENVFFLQDSGCEIEGVKFFGLAYGHPEELIPENTDVVITHEPPVMILDETVNTHWGNAMIRNRVLAIHPRYHLFGHAHDAFGIEEQNGIVFSNGALTDDFYQLKHFPNVIVL